MQKDPVVSHIRISALANHPIALAKDALYTIHVHIRPVFMVGLILHSSSVVTPRSFCVSGHHAAHFPTLQNQSPHALHAPPLQQHHVH